MKGFRAWDPEQELLFSVSPREWLPQDHLVYCLLDVLKAAKESLERIERRYHERDARGERAYHPAMMAAMLLYGYATGMPSSRRLERATYEDVGMRVLKGGQHPDHTRISEFRRQNLEELGGLFFEVLHVCQKAGMVKLGHVALDGTKVKANASKHKAMSYERMVKSERELQAEVKALLERAEQVDTEEDERFGRGVRGDELPVELRRREQRLARIQAAKAELEAEAAAERERAERERTSNGEPPAGTPSEGDEALPRHRVKTTKDGRPDAKAQRNFTDPDSRIMKSQDGFIQGYNGQLAVDGAQQVIVAHAMTNQPPDVEHLVPMLERIEAAAGAVPRKLSADAGYWSDENARLCEERGVDAFIATKRTKHGPPPPPVRGRPPKSLDAKGKMSRKLRTKKGRAAYGLRKTIVEPCFGQIKGRGFWRLLLRGVTKVRCEWALIATAHNLLKYHRFGWQAA